MLAVVGAERLSRRFLAGPIGLELRAFPVPSQLTLEKPTVGGADR
ncbi:MAG: hypothetical protein ABSE66_03860 [Thermoplasmata archaeon]